MRELTQNLADFTIRNIYLDLCNGGFPVYQDKLEQTEFEMMCKWSFLTFSSIFSSSSWRHLDSFSG